MVTPLNSCFYLFYITNFFTGLLGADDLPPNSGATKIMTCHTWQIDNKYYSASVQVNGTASTSCIDENLASQLQASVIYFDSQKV